MDKLNAISLPSQAVRPDNQAAVSKVAQEFEAVFLTQAVDEMMKTVKMGGFSGGSGEEQWKSFLSKEFANEIARGRNTGIAQSVEKMLKAYEA